MDRERIRPASPPEEREGVGPAPNGECETCGALDGGFDLDCLDCLETWLAHPAEEAAR